MQIIELQLPSFFDSFDPKSVAANFPSSKSMLLCSHLVLSLCILMQSILHEQILLLGVQAYLAGLTFALAASPCSTPVLATLLGYVAASKVLLLVINVAS